MPKVPRAERSHLESVSGFLRLTTESERALAVYKGYMYSLGYIPKDVPKSYHHPSTQLEREAGQDVKAHRAGQELGGCGQQL